MYRVWFEGFVDRYYKGYENAREACVKFIKMTEKDEVPQRKLLSELDMFDDTAICGIREIAFMDEVPACVPCESKKKYKVIFTKYETIEVEAYNEDEAEELAAEILDEDAYAWDSPADRITVEEI